MHYENLQRDLENLVFRTTKLEFPFFTGDKEKQEILMKEKRHIDAEIDCMIEKYRIVAGSRISDREKIWNDAKATAEKKFNTLPVFCRMNSFFLQELMHEYAENQVKWIIQVSQTD